MTLMLVCSMVSFSKPALLMRYGDVTGDKEVTTTDARLILQYAVGKRNYDRLASEYSYARHLADMDGDGEITTTDARLVLQAVVGARNYSCVGIGRIGMPKRMKTGP